MKKGTIYIDVEVRDNANIGELNYDITDNLNVEEVIAILSASIHGILLKYAPSSSVLPS